MENKEWLARSLDYAQKVLNGRKDGDRTAKLYEVYANGKPDELLLKEIRERQEKPMLRKHKRWCTINQVILWNQIMREFKK